MIGEILSLLSAASFGLAGAAIAKGASDARGDNGAFLSIVLTMIFAAVLWSGTGGTSSLTGDTLILVTGSGFFVASGLLATVFGRLTNFKTIALAGAIRASLFRRLIPVFATILAVLILDERYPILTVTGMLLILGSIGFTMREKAPAVFGNFKALTTSRIQAGAIFGVACAFFYASGYIARKAALEHVPDAAFGAMVGAVTGIVWYICAAPFSTSFRNSLVGVLRDPGPWQWVAAASLSSGQVLLFFALMYTDVAVVAIIGTTEIFVGAYLAAYLFKTEPPPGGYLITATLLATAGVVLVALG